MISIQQPAPDLTALVRIPLRSTIIIGPGRRPSPGGYGHRGDRAVPHGQHAVRRQPCPRPSGLQVRPSRPRGLNACCSSSALWSFPAVARWPRVRSLPDPPAVARQAGAARASASRGWALAPASTPASSDLALSLDGGSARQSASPARAPILPSPLPSAAQGGGSRPVVLAVSPPTAPGASPFKVVACPTGYPVTPEARTPLVYGLRRGGSLCWCSVRVQSLVVYPFVMLWRLHMAYGSCS